MKVNHSGSNPLQGSEVAGAKKSDRAAQAAQAGKTAKAAEIKSSNNGDAAASISAKAREFARAKEVASDAPDVREEKIAALKARIAEGKYKTDANAIADRMVNDHLMSGIG